MLVNQPTTNLSSYILPRDSKGWLRSYKPQSRDAPCMLIGDFIVVVVVVVIIIIIIIINLLLLLFIC
jgi:hypothetical protein